MRSLTYELTDLAGRSYGEIQSADQRNLSLTHWGMDAAGCVIPFDDTEKTLRQIRLSARAAALLKVYWGASLEFHGPVTNVERVHDASNHSVQINAGSPFFNLTGRLMGKSTNGTVHTNKDSGRVFRDELVTLNDASETGIETLSNTYTDSGSQVTYTAGPYKPATEVLSELSQSLDGFDWRILPIEYNAGKIGQWQSAGTIGQRQPNHRFEYGGGKHNVAMVRERVDRQTQLNLALHIHETGIDSPNAPVVSSPHWGSIGIFGLREGVISASITRETMRKALTNEHVRVRGMPRRTIDFQPHVYDSTQPYRVPQFRRDFLVGDWLWCTAQDQSGNWLDGWTRVYGITFTPDKQGFGPVTLTLVPDEGATEAG